MRKAVKTADVATGANVTGRKAGVNENVASACALMILITLAGANASDSFHPHVLAQKGWHVEVLAFHDCRLAFFKATAGDGLELQNLLLRCGSSLFALRVFRFNFRREQRFLFRRNDSRCS